MKKIVTLLAAAGMTLAAQAFPLFPESITFYHAFEDSAVADLANGKDRADVLRKPVFVPGLHGKAMLCGKGGGFLRFTRKDNLNFDKPGTILLFYKPQHWEADKGKKLPRLFFWAIDNGRGYIGLQGANDPKHLCMCERPLHLYFLYGKRLPSKAYEIPPLGKEGCKEVWNMLAFSWAGDKLYVKINDKPAKVLSHPLGLKDSDFPADYFSIGAANFWNYLMDDFTIYNRRLSEDELNQIYKTALKK